MAKSDTKPDVKPAATNGSSLPPGVKIAKRLVVPQLKMEQHKPIYFKVTSVMYVGKANPEKPDDKPADLCHVIAITDGEEKSIVVPAVLKSVWDEDYKDGKYNGKAFMVTKGEKQSGKRYFNYDIAEIEIG